MLAALQVLQVPIVATVAAVNVLIVTGLARWTTVIRIRDARARRDSVR